MPGASGRTLEGRVRVGQLYNLYGPLLTPRQRRLVELYYLEDLSLAEIAEQSGVTRQAVHDALRRAVEALSRYEQLLRLDARRRRMARGLVRLGAGLEALAAAAGGGLEAEIEGLRACARGLLGEAGRRV